MNKKLLIGISVFLVLGLAGGGYYWWAKYHQSAPSAAEQAAQAVTDIQDAASSVSQSAAQGVLPNVDSAIVNPMEDIPDVNPYKNANPFSDIKTNPFK